jgi:hypothetical protein
MSSLNSNRLDFTGIELGKLTSKNSQCGDEGGRNDRAGNSRPSREIADTESDAPAPAALATLISRGRLNAEAILAVE